MKTLLFLGLSAFVTALLIFSIDSTNAQNLDNSDKDGAKRFVAVKKGLPRISKNFSRKESFNGDPPSLFELLKRNGNLSCG